MLGGLVGGEGEKVGDTLGLVGVNGDVVDQVGLKLVGDRDLVVGASLSSINFANEQA